MDHMSPWRRRARSVILAALKEAAAQGLVGRVREKFISDRYPFGERAMHPYKIWLDEFAVLVKGKTRPVGRAHKKGPKLTGEWPMMDKQRELFGGNS